MIVGAGSASWQIVRDLAARLPVMVLPRWLRSRTQPVAIDDVVAALVASLAFPLPSSAVYDLPGPDILTGRAILEATAGALGLRPPLIVEVPVLSPALSSHWVRLVSRANWPVAHELVLGLANDLLARDAAYWTAIGWHHRQSFAAAAAAALLDEREDHPPGAVGGLVERGVARLRRARLRT
jgi:uncharacterized protein YbjT (DUF2867 family)